MPEQPQSLTEQGAAAYRAGEPCRPPDELHMIQVFAWANGWLEAQERDNDADNESTSKVQ